MPSTRLGDQELALLRFVSTNGPVTSGEAAQNYGEPNGLARSTVETVLARLHKKGFLTRSRKSGLFVYKAAHAQQDVMGGLVEQFVENKLAGSLIPLVTYFSRQNRLTDDELAELHRLVLKLEGPEPEATR